MRAARPQFRRYRPPATAEQATRGAGEDARRANRSIVIVATVVILVVFSMLLWVIAEILLLLFAGVLLAVFLRGLTDTLSESIGIPTALSFGLVLLSLASVLVLGGVFLGTEISLQLKQLGPRMSETWAQMLEGLNRNEWLRALFSEENISAAMEGENGWLAHVGGFFSTALGALAGLLIVIFIGVYAAAAPATYRRGLLRLIPPPGRDRAANLLDELTDTLRWWMVGTFAKMTMVGVSVTIGLLLLDIPLALALGLIAFLFDFVPYLGPVLAALPAVLVALAVGPDALLYVLLLYLGVQTAENYLLAPLVDQRSVSLPPALAIGAQVVFGGLLGVLGVVFATPLAASAIVIVNNLYLDDEELLLRRSASAPRALTPRPP